MKSDVIQVSSREDRTDLVLEMTDQVADYHRLSEKNARYLRLLAEEMMGMMRAITGDVNGEFWIETKKAGQFELHLYATTKMDPLKRSRLLAASTSGKNEANRGFMGKIRAFFEPVEDLPLVLDMGPEGAVSSLNWSMQAYQQRIKEYVDECRAGADQAWDELEQSVVAHLADEVKIRIEGFNVEMTVYKNML